MEALIIVIGELVLGALIIAVFVMVELVVTLITGGLSRIKTFKKPKWLRRLTVILTGVFAFIFLGIVIIQLFFFEPAVQWALGQVEARKGIRVTFDSAEGSLFSGTLRMKGVKLERGNHSRSQFDLEARDVSLDIDMTALLVFRTRLEDLRVSGLRGEFRRVGGSKRLKPLKSFVIENFVLDDMRLRITRGAGEGNPVTTNLEISRLESAVFRSKLSIYDLLFRSEGRGILQDSSFLIERTGVSRAGSGESRWYVEAFPLELMGAYMGGPMALISEGSIELEVKNRWQGGDKPGVEMDWDLVIRNVKARVPDNYSPGGIIGKMAAPVAAFINRHSKEFELRFRLEFEEEAFRHVDSLDGAGVWKAARKAVAKELLRQAVINKDRLKDLGKKGIQKFKDFLKQRKKKD
ncbi:MAG: hypothetical protein GY940_21960 [bacterium]|nr:hypothetical protein [bacterium]